MPGMTDDLHDLPAGFASYFKSIESKHGRPIAEFQQELLASGLTRHMEMVEYLKREHGMGHGHANALVAYTIKRRDQGAG